MGDDQFGAIEWVKRCPHNEECEIEIRQVFEAEDFGPEFTPEFREQEERLRDEVQKKAAKPWSAPRLGNQSITDTYQYSLEGTAMSESSQPQKKPRSILFTLLKVALLLVLVAVAAFLVVGFFVLDGKYDVSREITINASPEAVHKQVGDLREWPNWLPFTKHDTSVKTTIEQPTGIGAHQHWTGKDGAGELTFTASHEDKGVEFSMLFDKKWKSKGALTYARSGDETRVTWRMTGQNDDFMGKWLALAMPSMVGPMFDEGLADLKTKVEAK